MTPVRAPTLTGIRLAVGSQSATNRTASGKEGESIQWRKLLRYKGTISVVFFLAAIPGLIGVWMSGGPKYVAKGKIHVRPIIPRLVFQTEESGPILYYESYISTQIDILRGPVVMQRVVNHPNVKNTAWYRERFSRNSRFAVDILTRLVSVKHEPGSEVIDISFGAKDPNDAAIIVNRVLDEYVGYSREMSLEDQDFLYQQLQAEYKSLQKEIEERQKVAAELRKKIGSGTPDTLVSQKRVRLDELESQLKQIDQETAIAIWQQRQFQDQIEGKDRVAEGKDSKTKIHSGFDYDEEWRRLSLALKATRQELETSQRHWGDQHPKIADLRAQVTFLESQLQDRENQLRRLQAAQVSGWASSPKTGVNPAKELSELPYRINLLKYKKQLLQERLKKQMADFDDIFASAQLLTEENEAIRYRKEIRDAVRSRLDQKELERKVPGSIEIMMRAVPPNEPEADRRVKLSLVVIVFGLVAGLAVGHYRVNTTKVIQEVSDLHPDSGGELLGQLPVVHSCGKDMPDEGGVQRECIRIVRTTLLQRLGTDQNNAVVVTSAESGVGKTTVSVMLARSLARCGKRVLLVDADLRRPAIAKHLGIGMGPGLSDILMNRYSLEDVVVTTDSVYMDVIPAGDSHSGDYPELLTNGTLAASLIEWRRKYDMVILDTPPVLPVADTRIISKWVDGTVLVVREGFCQREAVRDAMQSLSSCGAKVLGMVYIGVDKRSYKSAYYEEGPRNAATPRGARA